jgi:hypothetical protein
MTDENNSLLAQKMLLHLNQSEIEQIENWLTGLISIRNSEDSFKLKFQKTVQFTKKATPVKSVMKLFALTIKEYSWDKRGRAARFGGAGIVGSLLVFGPQGAGIAAFGTAIGIPLFIVFGAGGLFAGVVLDEIARNKKELHKNKDLNNKP